MSVHEVETAPKASFVYFLKREIMDKISSMIDKKNDIAIVFGLLICALVVRLIVVIFWIDVPGDAPGMAINAWKWWNSPYMKTHGTHLPGIVYLGGLFHIFIHDPWISTRVFNMIIGSLTVPIFYLLISRIFSTLVGLLSALVLIFFPIHLASSGSSLKEASFLLEIITGMLFLIIASEKQKKENIYISLSLLCFCLAEATRYEGWLLIPIIPLYYWLKTKKILKSIVIFWVLLIFPTFWVLGNYFHFGNADKVFSGATDELQLERGGAKDVNWKDFIKFLIKRSVSFLGPILAIATIIGLTVSTIQVIKRKVTIDKLFYFSIFTIQWLFIFKFFFSRGGAIWNRYLVLNYVLTLPFAVLPLTYLKNHRKKLVIVMLITIISLFIFIPLKSYYIRSHPLPPLEITRKYPTEIKDLAFWLKQSSYRNSFIIVTEMTKNGRKQRYLSLYFPEVSYRRLTIWDQEEIVTNSRMKKFIEKNKPSLLITSKNDNRLKTRVENHLSNKLSQDRLVYQKEYLEVYDITGLSN